MGCFGSRLKQNKNFQRERERGSKLWQKKYYLGGGSLKSLLRWGGGFCVYLDALCWCAGCISRTLIEGNVTFSPGGTTVFGKYSMKTSHCNKRQQKGEIHSGSPGQGKGFLKARWICVWCVSPIRRQGLFYRVRGASGLPGQGWMDTVSSPHLEIVGGWERCCTGFPGSHENVFIGNPVPRPAVPGDAGVAVSHPATACPCSLELLTAHDCCWMWAQSSSSCLEFTSCFTQRWALSFSAKYLENGTNPFCQLSSQTTVWRWLFPPLLLLLQGCPCLLGVCWELCCLTGTLFQGQ